MCHLGMHLSTQCIYMSYDFTVNSDYFANSITFVVEIQVFSKKLNSYILFRRILACKG